MISIAHQILFGVEKTACACAREAVVVPELPRNAYFWARRRRFLLRLGFTKAMIKRGRFGQLSAK